MIRPFVGLGITYAAFMKETGSGKMTALTNPGAGTADHLQHRQQVDLLGPARPAWNVNEKWVATAAFLKTRLRTDVHFSTGQYQHMKLDPNAYMMTVGYKF